MRNHPASGPVGSGNIPVGSPRRQPSNRHGLEGGRAATG
jgi:hypothetical protein